MLVVEENVVMEKEWNDISQTGISDSFVTISAFHVDGPLLQRM